MLVHLTYLKKGPDHLVKLEIYNLHYQRQRSLYTFGFKFNLVGLLSKWKKLWEWPKQDIVLHSLDLVLLVISILYTNWTQELSNFRDFGLLRLMIHFAQWSEKIIFQTTQQKKFLILNQNSLLLYRGKEEWVTKMKWRQKILLTQLTDLPLQFEYY